MGGTPRPSGPPASPPRPAPPLPVPGSGDAVGAVGGAEGAPGLPAPGGRRRSGGGASADHPPALVRGPRGGGRGGSGSGRWADGGRADPMLQRSRFLSFQPSESWGTWRWSCCGAARHPKPAKRLPVRGGAGPGRAIAAPLPRPWGAGRAEGDRERPEPSALVGRCAVTGWVCVVSFLGRFRVALIPVCEAFDLFSMRTPPALRKYAAVCVTVSSFARA